MGTSFFSKILLMNRHFLNRGADTLMTSGGVSSPHSHPGMIQQQQAPPIVQQPGQSPLARYMMSQSPQNSIYRPQMSPMNMISKRDSNCISKRSILMNV